jgi:acetoacetyl-CoA reductase
MARVAIVTGGTRGIGEAISLALREAGMTVAANYAGNEERARAFTERTGIKSYKFDVGDFDAVMAGVRQIESELGPVDMLDQQCRHHPRRAR